MALKKKVTVNMGHGSAAHPAERSCFFVRYALKTKGASEKPRNSALCAYVHVTRALTHVCFAKLVRSPYTRSRARKALPLCTSCSLRREESISPRCVCYCASSSTCCSASCAPRDATNGVRSDRVVVVASSPLAARCRVAEWCPTRSIAAALPG